MKYLLVAQNTDMLRAWETSFGEHEDLEIVENDITQVSCDAMVSPANSFGFMDGGLDYALSIRFGWDLQNALQQMIKELPEGELLVGKALTLETGDAKVPYLISSPTMRIPTNYGIPYSVNAYLAMKATLIEAIKHAKIEKVAIPSFCTGVGGMDLEIASHQMWMAYSEIVKDEKIDFPDFAAAQKYHYQLNKNGMIWTH